MDVSVVITCWNGRKLLEKNLPQLIKAFKNKNNKISEIIVVDDFSSDNSVAFLKENYPQINIIEQPKNYGYSVTCNTGVSNASSELVAILNLDVVPSINFLEKSLPIFNNNRVFAVSFNEGNYGPGKLQWKDGYLQIVPCLKSKLTSLTAWCNGGSSVFRKSIWQEIGGMDKIYLPFYFEDIDLCLRAYKFGYECYWEPKSIVSHEHEATINKKTFKIDFLNLVKQRNHLLLTWRNIDNWTMLSSNITLLIKRSIKTPGYVKIIISAIFRLAVTKKINISRNNLKSTGSILKLLNRD